MSLTSIEPLKGDLDVTPGMSVLDILAAFLDAQVTVADPPFWTLF